MVATVTRGDLAATSLRAARPTVAMDASSAGMATATGGKGVRAFSGINEPVNVASVGNTAIRTPAGT